MTKLSDQIVRELLLTGRQSADKIGRTLDFSTPVIERQIERMVEEGAVAASVDTADGPVLYTLTEEERRRCRRHKYGQSREMVG